ncbi:hypothetical protein SLEP1_g59874 [Rubroshorea leprosula]|uniref:Uncharacterized protein n=1 Tax=Rubroshorea leprosula TaxID=152421 RepID=A0AAV5MX95_9ROSI|nr:hypothetical protein SLEP1_g59874 [Rubroshorea leprosula]
MAFVSFVGRVLFTSVFILSAWQESCLVAEKKVRKFCCTFSCFHSSDSKRL